MLLLTNFESLICALILYIIIPLASLAAIVAFIAIIVKAIFRKR